jgi:hypothetical protein
LALDYLLASEGTICKKFNLNNCRLQTDNKRKAIKEVTDKMRKLAHVPSRLGEDGIPMTWLEDVLCLRRIQNFNRGNRLCPGSMRNTALPGPLVLWSLRTVMKAVIERKTAAYVMMLWKYKPLDQGDAL